MTKRKETTPLLEQKTKRINNPIMIYSISAGIESFYRSAMASILNSRLKGIKAPLFPNMHIQIPTRIVYINGFKGIRQYLDEMVKPGQYSYPLLVKLGAAVTPGLCMTPVSSILEACNAGHSNPEPLYRRWTRGLIPRGAREVIFGVGLNQLSDYCEERVPHAIENHTLRNAFGSMAAGVMSGYMSHVVHNLSTLKLMNPNKSYMQHFSAYVAKSEERIPQVFSPVTRKTLATVAACLFPKGVHIRTGQIVGSFIILNGTISAIQRWRSPSNK